ncbi:1,4-alpha-glucan branching protein GlgB [Thalassotalea marina]|uniref:1,4-alpha-glucan branching enzyme GlgB n=1 Tax=Thalassotalea marina TaxID=1673741 RepID=A0A919ELB0_9GAMM|nr:1,4-alpha-glucan branching protein GlgB [Thalassotalea marina]GHF95141.1 1,4-alpha-glucan branching enzyme GlgB [Thalassotalea marina]
MLESEVVLSPFEQAELKLLDNLQQASCEDVFAQLGIHFCEKQQRFLYRVFLPNALAVKLEASGSSLDFQRFEQSALFHLWLDDNSLPANQQLVVQYADNCVAYLDCYRFPSTLDVNAMYLFCEGTLAHAHRHLGAHPMEIENTLGTRFCVWAPNAKTVSVVGDFNYWNAQCHVMRKHPACGVWELFIPNVQQGNCYKYSILTQTNERVEKADPYAFQMQLPPHTASVVNGLKEPSLPHQTAPLLHDINQPISIYEVHLGSWRRHQDGSYLSYQEIAQQLIPYVQSLGFTHVQLMPVSEYPFDGSWGYQPVGMFSPSSRFGSAQDFADFIDAIKSAGLGVIADWVPAHFPSDSYGLAYFDGSHLYEHADRRQGFHPDWQTHIYNYDRAEVRSFLLSNAMFWVQHFQLDGLRVDAVASMLYLDYSREDGEWVPNCYGGRENLGAISLLQHINQHLYHEVKPLVMVAEESTAWPGVTQMTTTGGLGFGYKWNMGWMNDTLAYMTKDPVHRKYHHHNMTFAMVYAFSENFILPLSHDEVVHGKGSMIGKMPGDNWQKHANLRAYYAFMWAHPGKKLLFMGSEFAQWSEWNHQQSLDWHLLQYDDHQQIQSLVKTLNGVYHQHEALYQDGLKDKGFQWLDSHNADQSILAFARFSKALQQTIVCISHFTPVVHHDVCIGVPFAGEYQLILNTDDKRFGGSNVTPGDVLKAIDTPFNGFPCYIKINVAPLATYYLKHLAQQ